MSKLLFPELPTARHTAAMLNGGSCPASAEMIARYGASNIERFAYISAVTNEVDLRPVHEAVVDDWDTLPDVAHAAISAQMAIAKQNVQHSLDTQQKELSDERLEHDSLAGASQIAAFLQIIPRVLFRTEFNDPNAAIADRARMSKGLMVRWSKLDGPSDAALVYGVAYPKPDTSLKNPYAGLRFHTKWFEEKESGAVGLRPEKLAHVRGENGTELRIKRDGAAIFGCPATQLVPRLYDAMTAIAQHNELFAETYVAERRNHAYDD